jgi:hypothetical protein
LVAGGTRLQDMPAAMVDATTDAGLALAVMAGGRVSCVEAVPATATAVQLVLGSDVAGGHGRAVVRHCRG